MNRIAVDRAEDRDAELGVGGALEDGGHEQQEEARRLRDARRCGRSSGEYTPLRMTMTSRVCGVVPRSRARHPSSGMRRALLHRRPRPGRVRRLRRPPPASRATATPDERAGAARRRDGRGPRRRRRRGAVRPPRGPHAGPGARPHAAAGGDAAGARRGRAGGARARPRAPPGRARSRCRGRRSPPPRSCATWTAGPGDPRLGGVHDRLRRAPPGARRLLPARADREHPDPAGRAGAEPAAALGHDRLPRGLRGLRARLRRGHERPRARVDQRPDPSSSGNERSV